MCAMRIWRRSAEERRRRRDLRRARLRRLRRLRHTDLAEWREQP
jgi:hypothetical protein